MLRDSLHSCVVLVFVFSGIICLGADRVESASVLSSDPPRKALILYDYDQNIEYGKLGQSYAIMLRNLLGHFQEMTVDMSPVQDYQTGDIDAHDVTFYMGSYYNNPLLPPDFLEEVMSTEKTVVWFKYNFWQLVWSSYYTKTITDDQGNQTNVWTNGFEEKFGFTFDAVRGFNAMPSVENPTPGFFDTVLYKNKSMTKHYEFNPEDETVYADPDVVQCSINEFSKVVQRVTVRNSGNMEEIPYIIQADNFWFVADLPFTFIGPRDRYLVICDLIHDMVGIVHAENHRALVRLEDVGALVSYDSMKELSKYFSGKGIPFSVSVIPFYRDPLGIFNNGVPQEIHLADEKATTLRRSLDYALQHGGSIVMHGYTHQYKSMLNPWSAISGHDYEFWNIMENKPVDEDSVEWVLGRLDNGLAELHNSGYSPFSWETPHYQASPNSYRAFTQRFPVTYQRAVYYTSDTPNLNPANPTRDVAVGQFYPYAIYNDYYGQRIIPENLGNIEYEMDERAPGFSNEYTPEDLITNASYALVIRDSFASFFFHPFLLEPEFGVPAMQDLDNTVNGISQLGYQWIDPRNVFNLGNKEQKSDSSSILFLIGHILRSHRQ